MLAGLAAGTGNPIASLASGDIVVDGTGKDELSARCI